MARTLTKREIAYYRQRKIEGEEWRALKVKAKAACDALTDLDELAEAARSYLIAEADLDKFERGARWAEHIAKTIRRANSPAYCRVWAVHQLAGRLMQAADAMYDMTPEERAAFEARSAAEAAALSHAINSMMRGLLAR